MTSDKSDRFSHPAEAQIAHQIRVELVGRGMNQGQLADLAGVGKDALSRYMQGHRSMRMDMFIRISGALVSHLANCWNAPPVHANSPWQESG